MAVATVDDVQARMNRPLTSEERDLAEILLDDVEARILTRIPDLLERVDSSTRYRRLVVQVEVAAVLRVIRNPDGFRQESEGNYSYSLSAAVASGRLGVLDSEWELLGGAQGAWTIKPVLRDYRCYYPDPWWPGECWP